MKDTTRAKFVTIAQKRMNAAIKAIRAVGDLGNRKNVLSETDVHQMIEELEGEVVQARSRLVAGIDVTPDFRLGADAGTEE